MGANVVGTGVECGIFERNKIGKISGKMEIVDSIEIEIMTSEK